MADWKRYEDVKPEKSGDYLILYDDGNGGNGVCADVGRYYIIINHPVTVAKAGFYADDDLNFWKLRPLFWAELPEAPEGHEY